MAGKIPDDWFRPDDPREQTLPASDVETTELAIQAEPATDPTGRGFIEAATDPRGRAVVPPPRRSGRGARILGVLVILGALGVGLVLGNAMRSSAPSEASPSPSASSSRAASYSGAVKQVSPTKVVASCTAPDATDSLGNPVTYAVEQVLDSKLDTAWRCDGDGLGVTLTFTLPANTTLVRVAALNGYGKTDPKSGESMYGQYRRVTSVTWRLPDGSSVAQSFADNGADVQQLELPATVAGGDVVLTITGSTAPGWTTTPTRNAVLLSEVQFFAAAK